MGLLVVVAMAIAAACSSGDDDNDAKGKGATSHNESSTGPARGKSVALPKVSGPVSGGHYGVPFNPVPRKLLARYGYREDEYFVSGSATAYRPAGTWGEDGRWKASPAGTAPYTTRVVVRRPEDPAKFNGTVLVEWLNVTAGMDSDPDFGFTHDLLMHDGWAYVGVSAQKGGIAGGGLAIDIPGFQPKPLQEWDPQRYAKLRHPGDAYSYDMFSQVARAVRQPGRPSRGGLLDGLRPRIVLASGESQSAFRMTTYVNAVHPVADIFDGFLIHSRSNGGAPVSDRPGDNAVPAVVHIRDDLKDPVLQFETETDLILLSFAQARQPDTDRLRTWEVAGTAHADQSTIDYGITSGHEWDPKAQLDFSGTCGRLNEGPQGAVLRKAVDSLRRWVDDGTPPAKSPPITLAPGGKAIVRDAHGNARGGIRTPPVDAPTATLTGERPDGGNVFCSLFGRTTPFDRATLHALYPTHAAYVAKVRASATAADEAGFLSKTDADTFIQGARRATAP